MSIENDGYWTDPEAVAAVEKRREQDAAEFEQFAKRCLEAGRLPAVSTITEDLWRAAGALAHVTGIDDVALWRNYIIGRLALGAIPIEIVAEAATGKVQR